MFVLQKLILNVLKKFKPMGVEISLLVLLNNVYIDFFPNFSVINTVTKKYFYFKIKKINSK